jgi:hypothetical protein
MALPQFQIQQTSEQAEILPLPDQSDIDNARRLGEKRISGLSDDIIKELRIKAKWDLLFLADGILGYNQVSPQLHGHYSKWLQRHRHIQYRLTLLPRGHYKSTIKTITDGIQTSLPDDTGNAIYPYNLGTNIRICIAHDVADMAQKFLRSITQHFTVNPFLIALFPECIPDLKKNRVNIKELELPRTAVWNESTFDTMGVGARGQGNHYNKLLLDDIYGEAARDSKTEREAHIQWFDNIQSFLITPATDQIDITGTRWAFDDVYAHAMKTYRHTEDDGREVDDLLKYIRSVWERDGNGNLQPIFPEQFSIKSLQILRKNKKVWNAQYINDPREGSAAFQPEWKRFFSWTGRRNLLITTPSTPFSSAESETINFEELDRIIIVDPAIGATKNSDGLTGIVVVGTDSKNRHHILECIKKPFKSEELCNWIFSAVVRWQPRVVGIEKVNFSALYEPWFKSEMRVRGIRFIIDPLETKNAEKALRVHGLSTHFQAGEIYFHASQEDLIEEFDQFGATDNYHMLDALAYGPRMWRRGSAIRQPTSADALNNVAREISTGYSVI